MVLDYGQAEKFSVTMEGPFGGFGGGGAKLSQVVLTAEGWKGGESPYAQQVAVEGVTRSSMVNLLLTEEQLERFRHRELAFTAVNEDGVVTVFAIGEKPGEDLTLQAAIQEVLL